MVFAGILAGGHGRRMGENLPKQFLEVGGQPILIRTIDAFIQAERFDCVYVAIAEDWLEYAKEMVLKYFGADSGIRIIGGGSDRTGSLLRVIDAINTDFGEDEHHVLVSHDAVRPFVNERIIDESIVRAQECGCAGTVIPTTDTIIVSEDGMTVGDIPDRSGMFRAQTPQSFRIGLYLDALNALSKEQRAQVTDVCGVFSRVGKTVRLVIGDEYNIKITTPLDLITAEAISRRFDKQQDK